MSRNLLAVSTVLACVLTAGCDPVGDDVIGPEGGVVVSEDGRLTIDIPQGALDEDVAIEIEEVEVLPEDALGPAYRVLPVGTVFRAPVHVLYDYDGMGADVAADDIALVVQRDDGWSWLPDRQVFADEAVVTGSALYLSTFCVVSR